MKAILVLPGQKAVLGDVKHELPAMQEFVGGYIEAVYPFDDPVALVCNEEGKLNNMEMNRVLLDADGKPYDIIAGPFFICGLTEDSFGDIPEELVDKYLEMFLLPEKLFPCGENRMIIMKYHPEKEEK